METMHNEMNKPAMNKLPIFDQFDFQNALNFFVTDFKNKFNSLISNIFYGSFDNLMTCYQCRKTIHNIQTFNILTFPIEEIRIFKQVDGSNTISIYDCFEHYGRTESLTGYNTFFCTLCGKNQEGISQKVFLTTPNCLIVNLNRGKVLQYGIKVIFDEFMNLKNYLGCQESPYYYELIGVVSNDGGNNMSSTSGHYIAFCKNHTNKKWYKFDDELVSESDFNQVLNEGEPYLLFFNRVKNKNENNK